MSFSRGLVNRWFDPYMYVVQEFLGVPIVIKALVVLSRFEPISNYFMVL